MNQRVLIEINKTLQYFTEAQKIYIKDIIDFSTDSISKPALYFLFKCAKSINSNTSEIKKNYFIEIIEQIFIKDTQDNIEIINSGENLFIEIYLRKDEDLSGSIILARLDENGLALSDQTNLGSELKIQRIMCMDLSLEVETFHRINILSEEPTLEGTASGNSNSLLNVIYLYVEKDIDYD